MNVPDPQNRRRRHMDSNRRRKKEKNYDRGEYAEQEASLGAGYPWILFDQSHPMGIGALRGFARLSPG